MAQRSIVYNNQTYDISYDIVNPKSEKVLLVLHGWGSNKEIMQQAFSRSLLEYKHVYVDMPGFGKSPNTTVLRTVDYANMMQLFCEALGLRVDAIMGHSFGGKVAALMNPPYMILLSSAGIPVKKRLSVRIKIRIFKFFKLLGLGHLY
jgi:pimeloyl-ACP methyl ester carboxylesterase